MPREIFPSAFECDCGHQSHFFENTIREMKAMSLNKKVRLCDGELDKHTIVFYRGKMVEILCPQNPKREHKTSPKDRDKQGKKKKPGIHYK
jgi:hypothetical protein